MYKSGSPFKHLDFILLDLICVTISFFAAFWGYHYVKLGTFIDFDTYDGAYRIIVVLIFLRTFLSVTRSGHLPSSKKKRRRS